MRRTPLKRKTRLQAKAPLKRTGIKRRKTTKAAAKRRKKGEWSCATADKYFSLYIRERDGKCRKCGTTENLTCSHYHRRAISNTRFDEENNIALCMMCHMEWEGPKTEYTDYMLNWLGADRYIELKRRAGAFKKRSEAIAEWKYRYENNVRRISENTARKHELSNSTQTRGEAC